MWTYKVYDTITGAFQESLPAPISCSGGRVLDEMSEVKLRFPVPLADFTSAELFELTTPIARTIVVARNGVPLAAAAFSDDDADEDERLLSLEAKDEWDMMAHRTTFGTNGYSGNLQTDNNLPLVNFSLQSMPAWLIWSGTEGPTPNYDRPIFLPEGKINWALINSLPHAGTDSRTYWDYEFNYVADALHELAKLGIETDFEPRISAAGNYELLMRNGTLTGGEFDCNLTSSMPWLFGFKRRRNSDKQANVLYSVGKGAEADMRVTTSSAAPTVPARERDEAYKDIDDMNVLQQHSDANLALYNKPTVQYQASMMADSSGIDGPKIEEMRIGSTIKVYAKDHPILPDGYTDLRMIGFTFDETEVINLTLQPVGA